MNGINSRQDPSGFKIGLYALAIAAALIAFAVLFGGWRTVSDATRDEQVRQELKWLDRDTFKLQDRVDALEQRVKALEAKP